MISKMPNWKSPGPDGVQGHWVKHLTKLHTLMADHLQKSLDNGDVPEWMTSGKTVLKMKDSAEGK